MCLQMKIRCLGSIMPCLWFDYHNMMFNTYVKLMKPAWGRGGAFLNVEHLTLRNCSNIDDREEIDGICCKKKSQNKSSLLNMVQCVYKYTEDSSCQSLYLSTRRENITMYCLSMKTIINIHWNSFSPEISFKEYYI